MDSWDSSESNDLIVQQITFLEYQTWGNGDCNDSKDSGHYRTEVTILTVLTKLTIATVVTIVLLAFLTDPV